MEKLKKVFSPGHQKDDEVLYGESNTGRVSGEGSHLGKSEPTSTATSTTTGPSTTTSHLGREQPTSSVGNSGDLRRQVLDSENNPTSRPAPNTHLSSASVADDASVASIRSGVVGAGHKPDPRGTIGAADYATGFSGSHPDRTIESTAGNATSTGKSDPRPNYDRYETMDPKGFVNSTHQHKGMGHEFKGDPCPPGDEPQVPGYPHHYKGPHGTDTANRLDPHVPGEFPTEEGEDPHGSHHHGRDAALVGGAGAAGLGAYEASKHHGERATEPTSASSAIPPSEEARGGHHYGRDAALAGGAGAAGIGAYEAGKHRGDAASDPTATSRSVPQSSEPRQDHHYSRDAALAAGAGAAGVGAYETNKHYEERSTPTALPDRSAPNALGDTGASSAVVSPSTTDRSFPLNSSAGNTINTQPASHRVESEAPREHHLGRDAALAGGAGAAALGAHEAGTHKHDPESHLSRLGRYDDQSFDPSAAHGDKPTHIPNLMYGSSTTRSGQSPESHHYGRDAAIAGGVGAAGIGASELHHRAGPTETDPASATVGRHKSNLANIVDPRVLPEPEKQKDSLTSGPHKSDMMNTLDPRVKSDRIDEPQHQHHYGRDAAVAGGVGTAGAAGAYEYNKHRAGPTETDPASKTVGPHQSNMANIVDPRVQPEPEKMKDRTTVGPHNSDTMNYADPRVEADPSKQRDHHYGRDAALAGGAGAAGVGAYEYGKHRTGHNEQDPASYSSGPQRTGIANSADPRVDSDASQQKGHHYGRDAAIAGGAGAAGVGAYEYANHRTGPTQQDPASFTTGPHKSNMANVVDPRVQPEPSKMKDRTTAGPYQSDTQNRADPRVDSDLSNQNKDHHYGRDAAIAGGAGAAGYGAYEALDAKQQEKLAKEQAKEAEKAQKAQQKEMDKEMKHQQKEREHEIAKQEKAAQKEREHEARKAEKEREHEEKKAAAAAAAAHEKEEKHHQKELEKQEKHHQKELEKEEKEREKEAEKGEKKHHLFGFLHRDKPKETEEEQELKQEGRLQEADQAAHERHQRELETGAAAGTLGTAGGVAGAKFEPSLEEQHEHPLASAPQYVSIDDKGHQHVSTDPSGRHRLHKDPPASVLREHGIEPEQS